MPSDAPAPIFDPDAVLRGWLAQRDEPCPACGYNLRGTDGRACPGCGVVFGAAIVLGQRCEGEGQTPPPAGVLWSGALAFMLGSAGVNLLSAGAILVRGGWIALFDPPARGDRGLAIVPLAAFGLALLVVLNGAMVYGWIAMRPRWAGRSPVERLAVSAMAMACCGALVSWPLLGA